MLIFIVFIFSLLIQLTAAYYALKLSKTTGLNRFWNTLAIGFGLIAAMNLTFSIFYLIGHSLIPGPETINIIALAYSSMTVAGLAIVHQYILSTQKSIEEEKIETQITLDELKRYKKILDATSDGVYEYYPQTKDVRYSPKYYTLLGYKDDEFAPNLDTWKSLVHPDDLDRVVSSLLDCLDGKSENFSTEFRMLTKSDEWIWMQSRGKIVERDEKGNCIRMIGTQTDINDRKHAEQELHNTLEQLKESEQKLQLKLDYILSPVSDSEQDEEIILTDLFDIKYLQEIQDAFAGANNIATLITDTDGKPITSLSNFSKICQLVRHTEEGNKRCIESNKKLGEKAKKLMKPTYEKCGSCGFALASAPVIVGGHHIGNCIIGHSNSMGVQEKDIIRYAHEIDGNVEEMVNAFRIMPHMPLPQFEKVLELLWVFTEKLSATAYSNIKLTRELEHQKLTELTLKEKEQNYLSLLTHFPGIAFRGDNTPDRPMIFMSKGCHELLGIKSEEITKESTLSYNDFIHPDDRYMVRNKVQEAIENHESFVLEYRVRHTDGTEFRVREKGHGIFEKNRNLITMEGFIEKQNAHS